MAKLFYCMKCGLREKPATVARGSSTLEWLLWGPSLALFLVGSWLILEKALNWELHVGSPIGPGGTMVAIAMVAAIPGFLFTIWRYAGEYRACKQCGSPDVIPADSPRARELQGY